MYGLVSSPNTTKLVYPSVLEGQGFFSFPSSLAFAPQSLSYFQPGHCQQNEHLYNYVMQSKAQGGLLKLSTEIELTSVFYSKYGINSFKILFE